MDTVETPLQFLERMKTVATEAGDNLLEAKVNQAASANKHRRDSFPFACGDRVMLSNKNQF